MTPMAADQNIVVSEGSAAPSLRVRITATAPHRADPSGRTRAGSNAPAPGRTTTKTPTRLSANAAQRRARTVSPRTGMDSSVTITGVTKETAVAWPTSRCGSPRMNNDTAPSCANPLTIWNTGDLDRIVWRDFRSRASARPNTMT
jgi:hypothetical protein